MHKIIRKIISKVISYTLLSKTSELQKKKLKMGVNMFMLVTISVGLHSETLRL